MYRYNQEYESLEGSAELQTNQIDRLRDGKGRISLESQFSEVKEWRFLWWKLKTFLYAVKLEAGVRNDTQMSSGIANVEANVQVYGHLN